MKHIFPFSTSHATIECRGRTRHSSLCKITLPIKPWPMPINQSLREMFELHSFLKRGFHNFDDIMKPHEIEILKI